MSTVATTVTTTTRSWSWWRYLAWLIRYTRIPILVVSVFSLGYQQGIIDCTRRPRALQESLMQGVLLASGVTMDTNTSTEQDDSNDNNTTTRKVRHEVHVVHESDVPRYSLRLEPHYQVAAIGHAIVTAAKQHVHEQLTAARKRVQEQWFLPTTTPEQARELMANDESVQFWEHAKLRLQGEEILVQNKKGSALGWRTSTVATVGNPTQWQYIFISSPVPNAFVTEILPHRIFITTGMLNLASTPDELAVVLGHEISHLILGHVSETNGIEMLLRTVEVLLLALDPTAGALSLVFIGGLAALRKAMTAAYSREHEREADAMGLVIAAKACYDTQAGAKVMRKMHQYQQQQVGEEEEGEGETSKSSSNNNNNNDLSQSALSSSNDNNNSSLNDRVIRMLDSHPPSMERAQRMQEISLTENAAKYPDKCGGMTTRFLRSLWAL